VIANAIEGTVVAVPSKGRLREQCLSLLSSAGYPTGMLHGGGALARVDSETGDLSFIEMRPRDAAAALAAKQLDAAFVATDLVMEHTLDDLPAVPLGFSRSDLVFAARDDDDRTGVGDFDGAVVATHLPATTQRFLAEHGVDATVVDMGGALEGVCASGLADAIVDLRETGTSLARNRLRVIAEIRECEALFVRRSDAPVLTDLALRLQASLDAKAHRYVMLHIPREQLDVLQKVFPGLASPTVLPLAGREDLVAVHFVVAADDLWTRLSDLRELGATGIVALEPQALLP
jgi:ATP phosphoribosyltransferase